MLKIFNDLSLFFEDNYREIHVREYAKLRKVSPPKASSMLKNYQQERLLKLRIDKGHHLYKADRESKLFEMLQRCYWQERLIPFIAAIEEAHIMPVIMLFGSSVKSSLLKSSDLDIAVFTPSHPEFDITPFEKNLKREIHFFRFKDLDSVGNPGLLGNILNGHALTERTWSGRIVSTEGSSKPQRETTSS